MNVDVTHLFIELFALKKSLCSAFEVSCNNCYLSLSVSSVTSAISLLATAFPAQYQDACALYDEVLREDCVYE